MNLLVAALLAGTVAVLVTVAIERLGGLTGGVIGTLPSTIVPASWGIWGEGVDPQGFQAALGVVPVGMLLNAGFLWLWRAMPPRLPGGSLGRRLTLMTLLSLTAWGVGAAAVTVASPLWVAAGGTPLGLGLTAFVAGLGLGLWATWTEVPAPRGRRPVGPAALLLRGALAASAIAVSVALARAGIPFVSGMASVFPAIFLTAMVGVWLAQGEAVPAGAVGPMMLGSLAVSGYAVLALFTFPLLGPGVGAAAAWLGAAVGCSVPAMVWLRSRREASR